MISSYKRPLLLSGQIVRFANQKYLNYDISVSIKGAPEFWVRQTFMQEWKDILKSGKLRVRFDDNKDQLANLLDTVRDVNLDDYDYFCKVDDDDWYAPTYLEDVNKWLNKEDDISISLTTQTTLLKNGHPIVLMHHNNTDLSGSTMCLSRTLIEAVLKLEKNPSALEPTYTKEQMLTLKTDREDCLFHELGNILGKVQTRQTSPYDIIFGQQYPSVMRGGAYLP